MRSQKREPVLVQFTKSIREETNWLWISQLWWLLRLGPETRLHTPKCRRCCMLGWLCQILRPCRAGWLCRLRKQRCPCSRAPATKHAIERRIRKRKKGRWLRGNSRSNIDTERWFHWHDTEPGFKSPGPLVCFFQDFQWWMAWNQMRIFQKGGFYWFNLWWEVYFCNQPLRSEFFRIWGLSALFLGIDRWSRLRRNQLRLFQV